MHGTSTVLRWGFPWCFRGAFSFHGAFMMVPWCFLHGDSIVWGCPHGALGAMEKHANTALGSAFP